MRRRNWSEKIEREDQRADDAATDAPAAEDDERDAYPATAGDDVEREAAEQRQRDEGAADGHQRAADHEGQVAGACDVDPGRVGRFGVLADGPDLEAEARTLKEPPCRRHHDQERDPGQRVLVEDGADLAQATERVHDRHRLDALELAAGEDQPVRELAEADEADREADARDMLVRAEGHGHQCHHRPGSDPDHDGGNEAEQRRAGRPRGREAGKGAGVHRALDAQVENAAALGVGLAHRPVHERGRVPERGRQQVDQEAHPGCASAATSPATEPASPPAVRPSRLRRTRQQRDRGQQQDALHHRAELGRDAERSCRGAGADREVAQEEGGERDARHGEGAQRGDHDPGVAVAG